MDQIRDFADERHSTFCAYCGGRTGTRDHVPSKVLLDAPLPENLPVVPACRECNNGFSLDEEYVACLIECALSGTTDPAELERDCIIRILKRKPALRSRLEESRRVDPAANTSFVVEERRVRRVVLKLARGHAMFEGAAPQLDQPSTIHVAPLGLLAEAQRTAFETPPATNVFPEVGSRAMQRLFRQPDWGTSWIEAQADRYRYLVAVGSPGLVVRLVLSEYLAAEVTWRGSLE